MSFYDQFRKPVGDDEFETVKFEMKASPEHPFVVEGVIESVAATDFGGARADKVPEFYLRGADNVLRQVAAGQVNLLRQVLDAAPDVGDHLRIEYRGEDLTRKKPGKNPPKVFSIAVTPKAMMGKGNGAGARAEAERKPVPVPDDDLDPF